MTTLWFSRRALADVDRFTDFVGNESPEAAKILEVLAGAVRVLRDHPYIGRTVESGLRELVISRGRTGYIALYEFDPARDDIVIHKLRHQREAGYSDD